MDPWVQALIDFGVLWVCSTFIALLGLVATNQLGTLIVMLTKSAITGAYGAGAGIGVLEKFGVRFALGLAALVSSGFIGKDLLLKLVKKKFGINDDGNHTPE